MFIKSIELKITKTKDSVTIAFKGIFLPFHPFYYGAIDDEK